MSSEYSERERTEEFKYGNVDRFGSKYDWEDVVDPELYGIIQEADQIDEGLGFFVSNSPDNKLSYGDTDTYTCILRMPLPESKVMEDLGEMEFLDEQGEFFGLPTYWDGDVIVRTPGSEETGRQNKIVSIGYGPLIRAEEEFQQSYEDIAETANSIFEQWEEGYNSGSVENMLD